MKWYRLAAAQAHSQAQLELGQMHRDGRGMKTDLVRAYTWIYLAAGLGNAYAKEEAASLEKKGLTPEEIKQGRIDAQACKTSAFKN